MREVFINVTADDIARGERLNECFCPFARAISRKMGVPVAVYEDGWVEAAVDKPYGIGQLSMEAVKALEAFDEYGIMEPKEYELLPDSSIEVGS